MLSPDEHEWFVRAIAKRVAKLQSSDGFGSQFNHSIRR